MSEYTEDDFSEVILSKIDPEKPLPSDVYLKVDNKFIKFKSTGDPLGLDKYELFISKGVKNIFILSEDIMDFLDWLNTSKEESESKFISEFGEDSRVFYQHSLEVKEKIYDVYFEEDLNPEIVNKLQENVADFVDNIKKNPITTQAISLMLTKNKSVANHSINTANLAVFIGMSLGHAHQFVLENIYMGAIFHDYGKLKVDPEILEKSDERLYNQAIQDHPDKGVKMLRKVENVPSQVLTIVEQHHEQFNGGGYPKGLKGDEIYGLAQIVSIANIFDNTLSDNKQLPEGQRNKKAIKVVEYDKGKMWNPKYINRVVKALNLAFRKKSSK